MIDQEPAFPVNFANDTEWDMEDPFGRNIPPFSNSQYTGMTKRELFAMKAMQGLLSGSHNLNKYEIARLSIEVAEELLLCLDIEE
jgi:hypothetical protein